jgi:hypothetical protein
MATIVAVVTDDARKYWPQFFGQLLGPPGTPTVPGSPPTAYDPRIKFFKVGEGGWVDPGGGRERRTPDASLRKLSTDGTPPVYLQDLDAVVDATRAPASQRYASTERATFKKDLSISDFSFISPTTIEIDCLLDFSDFNDDGYGNSPEIWEIGIFADFPEASGLSADQGLMIAYGTFPKEEKDASKQILNVVRIIF